MSTQKREIILNELRKLCYPAVVREVIENRLERIEISKDKSLVKTPHFCYQRIQKYENNIKHLNKLRRKSSCKIKAIDMPIVLPSSKEEIEELAEEVATYFSQGFEMYKSSLEMDKNSSPIIEYYSLLQIIKAVILLELDAKEDNFFNAHGLGRNMKCSPKDVYQATTKKHGVFAAILIRFTDYLKKEDGTIVFKIDEYLKEDYSPTLKNFIEDERITLSFIPEAFIFAWMLSEIARYQPVKWKEICKGSKNKWILTIDEFREQTLPDVIQSLITSHIT